MGFTISEVRDPVAPQRTRTHRNKGEFTLTLEALPLGKAIIVTGMRRSNLITRATSVGKGFFPRRHFRSQMLEDGSIQITRIA